MTFIFTFLPAILLVYYLADRKYRNLVLCIFSLFFYAYGEPKLVLLMIISIIANYYFALLITRYKKRNKLFLVLSLVFNLGLLGFFKYFNFGVSIIAQMTGLSFNLPIIGLPIGISFYTFQILSYVIDVYRGKVEAQKSIIKLGTYIAFFPQLIAGPIVQYKDIEKQLDDRRESVALFIAGVKRFILGLAKKIIIANNVAYIADTLYAQPIAEVSTTGLWIAAIAYMLQIYFDFSGYSDMAIGLGKMFGFNFLENFNYPYIAKSVSDFWRRWHISLSMWFRDYVYIPLGGNRCSKIKWIRNFLIVWLLTGIWHGANWNFIIWGVYYGIILLCEKLFLSKKLEKAPAIIRWLYTMFVVIIGWVIFRVEDLGALAITLGKMFGINGSFSLSLIFYDDFLLVSTLPYIIFGIFLMTPLIRKIYVYFEKKCLLLIPLKYVIYLGLFVLSVAFLLSNAYNPFIYFRF